MAIRLSKRVANISYEIRDIVTFARKVEASDKKIHWFNIGDPNQFGFRPPQHVTDAIIEALRQPRYSAYCPSEGDPELRHAVAKIEGVPAENVTIHSGLSEGIDFLFQALIDPGDNVLLPSPGYPLYNTKLMVSWGAKNYYPTDRHFHPNPEEMRARINKKTKALVVINPNNPTGATYPRSLLKKIADLAAEHSLPIISDEIYDKITLDDEKAVNMRDVVSSDQQLISGNGISKNYIYPGARVGYLALHGPDMEGMQGALAKLCNQRLSVNWEMQRGALAAYTQPMSHIEGFKSELRKRRDIVYKELNEIPGMSCAKPKAAFYSFPKIETKKFADDRAFVYSMLEETGVLVVPGMGFSPVLDGKYFRLVYLAPPEELHEAIGKIAKFVEKSC
ncbi:MAG: aminotransferase class I/II-fold pyridoxal phosphate-dependent enzyme [Candidatus Micrarchaeota archaeon]|nr:aminotransferase class I/II-fold pyridoxal phosphate-dependent enzyme [Candidatus Micrarchaeota archaeon]